MEMYYDCKTCGKPYGFGRVYFEPAECNRCDPPPPYVPEPSDFEQGEMAERSRIIELLEDIKNEPQRKQENWLYKVARTAYADATIKLIKGEK
jgi:hypothetical protein